MRISFSPQCRNDTLIVSKMGDVFTINDDVLDLTTLADGSTIKNATLLHPFLTGDINRSNGEIEITFTLPFLDGASENMRFPADIIDPPDGPIDLPHDPEE